MSAQHAARSVSVIGLGPMGRSIVEAFLKAGVAVTVWNRSAEKADAMVELGARRAATVAEALAANEVTILSLTHYAAMYDVLGPVVDRLPGKVIVNTSSDSPGHTRQGAVWVRAHGGQFLAGGVMAQSGGLAEPASYIFYSGPREVFDAHAELLRPLCPPEYLGTDDGLAQLYYQGVLTIFLPLLLAAEQAFATIDRSGSSIERFLPYAQRSLGTVGDLYAGIAAMAPAGGWAELAHLRMMAAGAQHVVETGAAVGVDTTLADAVRTIWRTALERSEGADRVLSTYQLLRGARP